MKATGDEKVETHYELPGCPNCGAVNKFIHENDDEILGDYICTNCGEYCEPSKILHTISTITESKADNYLKNFKHSYNREAHLFERIRQHITREPKIAKEHQNVIRLYFDNEYLPTTLLLLPKNVRENENVRETVVRGLTKANIGTILRSLEDRYHNELKYKYSMKYLEKWKTIKKMLLNNDEDLEHFSSEDLNRISTLFLKFSAAWNEMQPPQMKYKRGDQWVFSERKHFPNFNFMIRKCCELLEIEYDPLEWPIPKSTKSLNKLQIYYETMLGILGLVENKKIIVQKPITDFTTKFFLPKKTIEK